MTQYNTLNITSSNSQLNKLKSGKKNDTEVTLNFSSNVVDDSNDDNNFLYKLLLTNTQVSKLRNAFANGSSANVKLSKTQLHKIRQSRGYLGRLLGVLLETGLPLMKTVLKPLAKSVLISLGVTAAASATNAAIQKKVFGSRCPLAIAPPMTTLIVSNEEMNGIMKRVKFLGESGLLIKGISETIKNENKEQKGRLLGISLGSLLRNLLTGKGTSRAGEDTI